MKTSRFDKIEDLCAAVLQLEVPSITVVDNGIGAYEYWGFKGFDSQPDVEVERPEPLKVQYILYSPSESSRNLKIEHNTCAGEFTDFISDILYVLEDKTREVTSDLCKKLEAAADDSATEPDFSDYLKLSTDVSLVLMKNSTHVQRIEFTFTWDDARYL